MPSVITIQVKTLILTGILVISVAANIIILSSSHSSIPSQKDYEQKLRQYDEVISREHETQNKLDVRIDASEQRLRAHELRDSLLAVDQGRITNRLNQIQNSYAKIDSRYRDLTKDSLRRLLSEQ
jgi:hypothetical protein